MCLFAPFIPNSYAAPPLPTSRFLVSRHAERPSPLVQHLPTPPLCLARRAAENPTTPRHQHATAGRGLPRVYAAVTTNLSRRTFGTVVPTPRGRFAADARFSRGAYWRTSGGCTTTTRTRCIAVGYVRGHRRSPPAQRLRRVPSAAHVPSPLPVRDDVWFAICQRIPTITRGSCRCVLWWVDLHTPRGRVRAWTPRWLPPRRAGDDITCGKTRAAHLPLHRVRADVTQRAYLPGGWTPLTPHPYPTPLADVGQFGRLCWDALIMPLLALCPSYSPAPGPPVSSPARALRRTRVAAARLVSVRQQATSSVMVRALSRGFSWFSAARALAGTSIGLRSHPRRDAAHLPQRRARLPPPPPPYTPRMGSFYRLPARAVYRLCLR